MSLYLRPSGYRQVLVLIAHERPCLLLEGDSRPCVIEVPHPDDRPTGAEPMGLATRMLTSCRAMYSGDPHSYMATLMTAVRSGEIVGRLKESWPGRFFTTTRRPVEMVIRRFQSASRSAARYVSWPGTLGLTLWKGATCWATGRAEKRGGQHIPVIADITSSPVLLMRTPSPPLKCSPVRSTPAHTQ